MVSIAGSVGAAAATSELPLSARRTSLSTGAENLDNLLSGLETTAADSPTMTEAEACFAATATSSLVTAAQLSGGFTFELANRTSTLISTLASAGFHRYTATVTMPCELHLVSPTQYGLPWPL